MHEYLYTVMANSILENRKIKTYCNSIVKLIRCRHIVSQKTKVKTQSQCHIQQQTQFLYGIENLGHALTYTCNANKM